MAREAFNNNLLGFRNVLGDFARSFMFRVNVPSWYGSDTLSMLGRSVTLPSYQLKQIQIDFQGMQIMASPVAEFDHKLSIKMLSDEKQVLRGNIMKWMSYAYDPSTMEASTLTAYKKDDVVIQQLDRMGKTIMAYKFFGVYPMTCGSPTFDHKTVEAQEFEVTFSYDFFTYVVDDAGVIAKGAGLDNKGGNDEIGISQATNGQAGAGKDEPFQVINKPPV